MPINIVRLRNKLQHTGCQTGSTFARAFLARLNDGEFIPAEAGKHIVITQRRFQPLRRFTEQLISGGMPERIVDILKLVEIHHEHGKGLAMALQASHGLPQFLGEECKIFQTGKYVMVRQKPNVTVRFAALGDVLMR